MPGLPAPAVDNAILAALPSDERARLAPLLEAVEIAARQSVSLHGEPMAYVYFPAGALFSLRSANAEGRVVEVGAMGREGFVGLPVLLEDDAPAFDTIGQVAGPALRMRAEDLRAELVRGGSCAAGCCASLRRSSSRAGRPRPATGCTKSTSAPPGGCCTAPTGPAGSSSA